jgi:hypothetical protein
MIFLALFDTEVAHVIAFNLLCVIKIAGLSIGNCRWGGKWVSYIQTDLDGLLSLSVVFGSKV